MSEEKMSPLQMLISATELAINSHGRTLTSLPPQDAWMYHNVNAKLLAAINACKMNQEYDVLEITTAYESGVGHAFPDELSNPYAEGSDGYIAWDLGREHGLERGVGKP